MQGNIQLQDKFSWTISEYNSSRFVWTCVFLWWTNKALFIQIVLCFLAYKSVCLHIVFSSMHNTINTEFLTWKKEIFFITTTILYLNQKSFSSFIIKYILCPIFQYILRQNMKDFDVFTPNISVITSFLIQKR